MVEAAVSAQDSLITKYTLSIKRICGYAPRNVRDDGDHSHIPKQD